MGFDLNYTVMNTNTGPQYDCKLVYQHVFCPDVRSPLLPFPISQNRPSVFQSVIQLHL